MADPRSGAHEYEAEILETTLVFPTLRRTLVVFVLFLFVSPPSNHFGLISDNYLKKRNRETNKVVSTISGMKGHMIGGGGGEG